MLDICFFSVPWKTESQMNCMMELKTGMDAGEGRGYVARAVGSTLNPIRSQCSFSGVHSEAKLPSPFLLCLEEHEHSVFLVDFAADSLTVLLPA